MSEDAEILKDKHQKYENLLSYIQKLLKRDNLCCNTYLYKQMKAQLVIPLYAFQDQKTIAQFKVDKFTIAQAIEESGNAKVFNNRDVKLFEFPTIKIHFQQSDAIKVLQNILEEQGKTYALSKRPQTNQYINLTIFSENIIWLEKLVESLGKEIVFERVRLLNDMRIGVDRIRKLKFRHAKQKTIVGKVIYSWNSPPEIFIRKALQSSDSEQQQPITKALGKYSKKTKRSKQIRNQRNQYQQFPELS